MSILFESIASTILMSKVTALKGSGNVVFANYYGLNDHAECEYFETPTSILIRKSEYDYFRIYIVSTDKNEIIDLLTNLHSSKHVINIPSKGSIDEVRDILEKSGFSFIGAYNRYYNNHIIERECEPEEFATIEDLDDILDLLYNNFSTYTDHLPLKEELKSIIYNNGIVVNRFDNGRVGGFVIHTIEGKKAYINAWLDKTGNGLRLMYQTYNVIERRGIKYVYLWINAENRNVIVLHRMMGAIPDGLVDYSFMKN